MEKHIMLLNLLKARIHINEEAYEEYQKKIDLAKWVLEKSFDFSQITFDDFREMVYSIYYNPRRAFDCLRSGPESEREKIKEELREFILFAQERQKSNRANIAQCEQTLSALANGRT